MVKVIAGISLVAGILFLVSCSKNSDGVKISGQEFMAGSFIQSGDTLNSKNGSNGRAIKGTLQSGQTYYLSSLYADATINSGDTLAIQSGVKVLIVGPSSGAGAMGTEDHAPGIVVNGTFLCLGTKAQPNIFTISDNSLKSDPAKDPQDPAKDPAFKGYWGGIQGGAGSGDVIIKWTRFEYMGGLAPSNAPTRAGAQRYGIIVQNPASNFVLEDCWLYGSANDCIRPAGCKYEIFRNTFEKVGITAGECVNVKSGSVGDIGYNLVVGGTGNAFKSANAGGHNPQASMICYNNTVITTGYRQAKAGEGGSIDFEQDGRGLAYNNILVDCAYGLGIRGSGGTTPIADTANTRYGYTYNYGDDTIFTHQFLPSGGFITKQQASDINGGNATTPGANNPNFVNYPLPASKGTNFNAADYVGNYNFHLSSNSPAIGKAYTGFNPAAVVKKDATFGVTEITLPGKDMGAFQTDGSGNQH